MPFRSEYIDALNAARSRYIDELIPASRTAIYEAYSRMLTDIAIAEDRGIITAERAQELSRQMRQRLDVYGSEVLQISRSSITDGLQLGMLGHLNGIQAASEAVGVAVEVGARFNQVPSLALELMVARRGFNGAANLQTIINRGVQDLGGSIDNYLTSMVGRGVSVRRASVDLAKMLAHNDPEVFDALRSLGPRGGRTLAAIREGVEIDPEVLNRAKRTLFESYRLTTNETNHAFFEADRLSSELSPVVDLLRWTLSGRHATLPTSPDVCDVVAKSNIHGFGEGLYHPATCPGLQHVFCQCRAVPVLRVPDQWDDPKREIPEAREVSEAEARKILEDAPGGRKKFTDNYVQTQTGIANDRVSSAQRARTGNPLTQALPQETPQISEGKRIHEAVLAQAEKNQEQLAALKKAWDDKTEEVGIARKVLDDSIDFALREGYGSAIYKDAEDRFNQLREERTAAYQAFYAFREAQNRNLHSLMYRDSKAGFTVDNKLRKGRDQIDQEFDFFRSMVGAGWIDNATVHVKRTQRQRSFAAFDNDIHLSGNLRSGVVVHEMGHFFEFENQAYFKRIIEFLEKRIGSDTPEWLGRGYARGEVAVRDDFYRHYMGKIYKRRDGSYYATEITSMALDYMYTDAASFARADPEMFIFILDLLREQL